MDVEQMTEHAEAFLHKNYDMKLGIPIVINNRLRSTLGQFEWHRDSGAERISINGKLAKYGAEEIVLDTLYHELIHYALWSKKIPHRDGCVEFESELRKYGVSSTGGEMDFGEHVVFLCEGCGEERLANNMAVLKAPEKYKSKCRLSSIRVVGTRILNGLEAI